MREGSKRAGATLRTEPRAEELKVQLAKAKQCVVKLERAVKSIEPFKKRLPEIRRLYDRYNAAVGTTTSGRASRIRKRHPMDPIVPKKISKHLDKYYRSFGKVFQKAMAAVESCRAVLPEELVERTRRKMAPNAIQSTYESVHELLHAARQHCSAVEAQLEVDTPANRRQRVEECLRQRGWTMKEFAAQAKIGVSSLYAYLSGEGAKVKENIEMVLRGETPQEPVAVGPRPIKERKI